MEDVYKTPEANLISEENSKEASSHFYVVSTKKFLVLFLSTQGIYLSYWMYKNWQILKEKQKLSCWPIARAIFMIFFFHDLYRRVDRALAKNNDDDKWKISSLATPTVILLILDRIIEKVVTNTETIGIFDAVGMLMIFVIGGAVFKAQLSINKASGDEFGESNSSFTPLNFLWILLGLSLWVLVIRSYLLYFS